jgi:hypothetical protein
MAMTLHLLEQTLPTAQAELAAYYQRGLAPAPGQDALPGGLRLGRGRGNPLPLQDHPQGGRAWTPRGKRGKSPGKHLPCAGKSGDRIDTRNKKRRAGASQVGRIRALT